MLILCIRITIFNSYGINIRSIATIIFSPTNYYNNTSWNVERETFEDVYKVTLEADFEVRVPMPVG